MSEQFKVNTLKLFFKKPIEVDGFKLRQPTIQDFMDYGEGAVYNIANVFAGNATSHRITLWEMGIDWNKISDFEVFTLMLHYISKEDTKIIFQEEIDFSKFKLLKKTSESGIKELALYNEETDMEITQEVYFHLAEYFRHMFHIFPEIEFVKGKAAKEMAISIECEEIEKRKRRSKGSSTLLPMISMCCNHPGFKYRSDELEKIGIYEFMDSVQRLQIYESTNALTHGMYSGMISMKDIDSEELNFMRDTTYKKAKRA